MATDPNSKTQDSTGEKVVEQVKQVAKGEDEPMEAQAPQASFGLITLAYPLLLIAVILAAFLLWGLAS